ncbi:MAG: polymer-forming cytoskeletal protein, partial [Coriobacteriales bacterium]|nr:polymer-forming cytoskeletal protein [Coriobacteriales bacterium]
ETGGSLIIGTDANITGNIYVNRGASLTIEPNCTIKGNIYCAGVLTIEGSFKLDALDTNPDNIELGMVSTNSKYGNATGIFIYNDATIGVGTLNVPNDGSTVVITNTAGFETGKIHSFVPYPEYATNLFGAAGTYDERSHVCTQFVMEQLVWQERPGSTTEEW